jgi:hypothetical protein
MFNFTFAHVLAVLLSAIAHMNPGENWMAEKGI